MAAGSPPDAEINQGPGCALAASDQVFVYAGYGSEVGILEVPERPLQLLGAL